MLSISMKDNLLIQYGAIRETISSNIETIGKLVRQAENLKGIIEKINGSTSSDIKISLENQITEIEGTIQNLIEQTSKLFDKYNEFVDSIKIYY